MIILYTHMVTHIHGHTHIHSYTYICVCVCVCVYNIHILGFPVVQLVKNLPAMQETWVGSLGWEDSLEKGKATHSSILAWRIPWTV